MKTMTEQTNLPRDDVHLEYADDDQEYRRWEQYFSRATPAQIARDVADVAERDDRGPHHAALGTMPAISVAHSGH